MKKIIFNLFTGISKALYGKGLWSIPLFRNLYLKFFKLLGPKGKVLLNFYGIQFYGYSEDTLISHNFLMHKKYEDYEISLFESVLKDNSLVIDIGANVGIYSLIAGKTIKKDKNVFAFEPDPKNFSLLVENIRLNNLENQIKPFNIALSNNNNENVKLFLDKYNYGIASFSQNNIPFETKSEPIIVKAITLDSFFEENSQKKHAAPTIVIKVDVQGAEKLIFESGLKLLDSFSNLHIFMEFWPEAINNVSQSLTGAKDLLEIFGQKGFKFFIIDENNKKTIEASLEEVYNKSKSTWSQNLYLTKNN